jgi:hypothetical protein
MNSPKLDAKTWLRELVTKRLASCPYVSVVAVRNDLAKAVVKLQPATVNRYLVEYFQVIRNATGQGRLSIARIVDYARQRQPATDELLESIKAGFSKNPALIDSH